MKRTIVVLCAIALAGCQVAPMRPDYSIVDTGRLPGTQEQYERDYSECAALANQTDVAARAAATAAVGAAVGAVLGALICGRSCAQSGAAWGGGYGVGSGATSGAVEQQGALRACLAGRGYNVIR